MRSPCKRKVVGSNPTRGSLGSVTQALWPFATFQLEEMKTRVANEVSGFDPLPEPLCFPGEIGKRSRFKPCGRKTCGFDSHGKYSHTGSSFEPPGEKLV